MQEDACLDEQEKQDLYEKVIDISDEDDVSQTCMAPESINLAVISLPVLPTLVANYESEDNGK